MIHDFEMEHIAKKESFWRASRLKKSVRMKKLP